MLKKPSEVELKEKVVIGDYEVTKEQLYVHTLALTTATMCNSLVSMIGEIKNRHTLWTTNVKNTLQKAELEIQKRLDIMADSPDMLEKMTDAEYICTNDINRTRTRIHSELYEFCTATEERRNEMILENDECKKLQEEIEHLSKIANIKALRQCVISLRKNT